MPSASRGSAMAGAQGDWGGSAGVSPCLVHGLAGITFCESWVSFLKCLVFPRSGGSGRSPDSWTHHPRSL